MKQSGVPKRGLPLKWGHQKLNFLPTHARHMKFLGYANMKKEYNMTKFGLSKWGVPLKQGRQHSNFLTTHARHVKFLGYANMKQR